jgi:putative transposase
MKEITFLFFYLLTAIAKLLRPGRSRAVIAENLLLKQQLIIHSRSRQGWPTYISSDNDPLFQYHRWKANLRVLDIDEIKSLPHVPMSHPFVERLIGSIRRELLDHTLFWSATDLENKLREYQCYYNESRTHSGRGGTTPIENTSARVVDISDYRWRKYCRGLFELPVAA